MVNEYYILNEYTKREMSNTKISSIFNFEGDHFIEINNLNEAFYSKIE